MTNHWSATVSALVVVFALILGVVVHFNGCQADNDEVYDALRSEGVIHSVKLHGIGVGKCDADERSREFDAINANGHRVHGIVCCGLVSKGCTVRW